MLSTSTILGIINIFLIIYKCRRDLHNVSFLLTCNTCLSGLLTCLTVCLMISSNLFNGFLIVNLQFGCVWGLFYDIFECSIYYSYCLQAFYRLCRVIFYKKKILLSYSLYTILIIGQWILVLVLLLPPVFIDWYARLPTENYCLIPYTYIGPEIYHILLLYLVPLICLGIIYKWITRYMCNVSQAPSLVIAATQRLRNQRDLTVIKRIVMLISILIGLRFPTVIFMIQGAITQSLYPLAYAIVGLITSICLILIGIITIHFTSQLRKQILNFFFHQNNRIQTEPIPLNQRNTSIAVIANFNNNQRGK